MANANNIQAQYLYAWHNPTTKNDPIITPNVWVKNANDESRIDLNVFTEKEEKNYKCNRISVYAPMGTQLEINGKFFIVGNSNILELGDKTNKDIFFNSLVLRKIKTVELDIDETKAKIEEGLQAMNVAIGNLLNQTKATIALGELQTIQAVSMNQPQVEIIEAIQAQMPEAIIINSEAAADYFIQFKTEFEKGYNTYIAGKRGIYKQVEGDYIPLENIIVDVNYVLVEKKEEII